MFLTRHSHLVERWSADVDQYRKILAPETDLGYWLQLMWGESAGDPDAEHFKSHASGLYQHLPQYWDNRFQATVNALKSAGVNHRWMRKKQTPFHPKANIAVAMRLYKFQGYGAWTASLRFPAGSYDENVWWVEPAGYTRLTVPSRRVAPKGFAV